MLLTHVGGNGFIAAHILKLLLSRKCVLSCGDVAHTRDTNLNDSDDVVATVRSKQLGEKISREHPSITPKKLQHVVVEDITGAGAIDKVYYPLERSARTR